MDIQGAEALALSGARRLVERSLDMRIIFEWSSARYALGSTIARKAADANWLWMAEQGFKLYQIGTSRHDGVPELSEVSFEYLCTTAPEADFVAIRC